MKTLSIRSLFFITLLGLTATCCAMNGDSTEKDSKREAANPTQQQVCQACLQHTCLQHMYPHVVDSAESSAISLDTKDAKKVAAQDSPQQCVDLDDFLKNQRLEQLVHKHGLSFAAFDANNHNSPFAQSLHAILDFLIGPKTTPQTRSERLSRMLNWLESCQKTDLFNNKHRLKLFREYWGDLGDMWEKLPKLSSAQNPHTINHFRPKIDQPDLNDLLLLAAASGAYQAIKILIATLHRLNIPLTRITDATGNNALHQAATSNDLKMFHILHAADPALANQFNNHGKYPINLAPMITKIRLMPTKTKIPVLIPALLCLLCLFPGYSKLRNFVDDSAELFDVVRIITHLDIGLGLGFGLLFWYLGSMDFDFHGDGEIVYPLTMASGILAVSVAFFIGLLTVMSLQSMP